MKSTASLIAILTVAALAGAAQAGGSSISFSYEQTITRGQPPCGGGNGNQQSVSFGISVGGGCVQPVYPQAVCQPIPVVYAPVMYAPRPVVVVPQPVYVPPPVVLPPPGAAIAAAHQIGMAHVAAAHRIGMAHAAAAHRVGMAHAAAWKHHGR